MIAKEEENLKERKEKNIQEIWKNQNKDKEDIRENEKAKNDKGYWKKY